MSAFAAALAAVILLTALQLWHRHVQEAALREAQDLETQAEAVVGALTASIAQARAITAAAPSTRDSAPDR